MIHHMIMTADEAIEKLKSGNMRYLLMNSNSGNVSAALRKFTYEHGQHPHAIIVTCSDSRVIPETIFSAWCPMRLFPRALATSSLFAWRAMLLTTISWAALNMRPDIWEVLWLLCWGILIAVQLMQPSTVIRKGILSLLQMRLSWRSVMKPMITKLAV